MRIYEPGHVHGPINIPCPGCGRETLVRDGNFGLIICFDYCGYVRYDHPEDDPRSEASAATEAPTQTPHPRVKEKKVCDA